MITEYLNQSVTHASLTGHDAHGQPTHGTPVTRRARYQQRVQLVRDTRGAQVVSQAQVFFDAGVTVVPEDEIAYGGATYRVIAVRSGQGFDTASHVVAYL